jgi:hypothetical protein
MDKYLQDVRKRDERLRQEKTSTGETEQINQLLKSGSTEDIQAYINQVGVDKAKELGLLPSDEIKQWYSLENLKKLYPDMQDEQINNIRNMLIDWSNPDQPVYRSNLYQNLYANQYGYGEDKRTYQELQLEKQKAAEEEKAYKPFTYTNPFLSEVPEGSAGTQTPLNQTNLPYTPITPTSTTPAGVSASNTDYWNVNTNKIETPQIQTPNIDVSSSGTFEERTQKVKNKSTGEIITVEKNSDWWKNDYGVV